MPNLESAAPATSSDGRSQRWDGHKAERRDQILAAAVVAIREDGARVGVKDIAARAGVPRSVVYRLFGDRDDLDEQVRIRIISELMTRLTPVLNPEGTVGDAVTRAVETYIGWIVTNPHLHRFLAAGSKRVVGSSPSVSDARTAVAVQTARLFAISIARHGGTTEVAEPLAFGLVGMVDNSVNRWLSRGMQPLTADELSRVLQRWIVNTIAVTLADLGVAVDAQTPVADLFGPDQDN
ncbi:TetR/AcrR family transcriptional regulator [Nocardia rosealba]|uniref:TetR/AcrR family transcriptional regulator n=1 Tax=Nocardia rosealba TaxID=2878563 RepID=UPI001CD9B0BD|nr:TetR/AcrR family transcriptional regulator [Nocardia rosealba]MCA2208849.1 TetR/AcrR family transcriptional regulator [Nocardia rosealba]